MDENNTSPSVIEVVSSVEMNEDQKTRLKSKALHVFDLKSADFVFSVDKDLIGGFLLRYKSMVCDLSIKEKLTRE